MRRQPTVNNHNFAFDASVNITEKNLGKRGGNTIELQLPDSLSANLSLSVFDGELSNYPARDIYSDMLLGNDIKGYVHEPAWYFNGVGEDKMKALDLVMQTNGWRRYIAQVRPAAENYIALRTVYVRNRARAISSEVRNRARAISSANMSRGLYLRSANTGTHFASK